MNRDNKYSYVCVISSDNYLDGALILYENLKDLNSKYDLICIINDNIKQETINTLNKYGIKTKLIKNNITSKGKGRWKYTFDKINIFSLIEYNKLVFLDLDLLILENIDNLFNYDTPAMCLNLPWSDKDANSGVMVIKPDLVEYHLMMDFVMDPNKKHDGDQDIINEFYKDKFNILPLSYNVMRSLYYDNEMQEKDFKVRNVMSFNKKEPDDIKIVHYIRGLKPFMDNKPFNGDEYPRYKKYLDIIEEKKKKL